MAVLIIQPEVLFLIPAENVFEAVRAAIIPGLYEPESAVEHLIAPGSFAAKVHFAAFFADLRDGKIIQLCTNILGNQPFRDPPDHEPVDVQESIAVDQILRCVFGEGCIRF